MQVKVGSKVTIGLPNGLRWPGVAISDETSERVTIVSRTTNLPVEITVSRFDVISLRESRAGDKYLALGSEVSHYGYRVVSEPRFNAIIGLDVEETGEPIGLQALIESHGAARSVWQAAQFEARQGATDAAAV